MTALRFSRSVERFFGELAQTDVQMMEVPWPRVRAAAHLKARHHISYADAFAVALAQELGATLVTGDPEIREVENLVGVEWLPRR